MAGTGRRLSIAPHHRLVAQEGIFIQQGNARTRPNADIGFNREPASYTSKADVTTVTLELIKG